MIKIKLKTTFLLLTVYFLLTGCVLTKVVTVPMRVGGAVVSIIPGVGNTAHEVLDKAAEEVDDLPL